jgi:hypothetical protein
MQGLVFDELHYIEHLPSDEIFCGFRSDEIPLKQIGTPLCPHAITKPPTSAFFPPSTLATTSRSIVDE